MHKTFINGISIAYEHQGHGTPFILLHGYPLDHTIWRPIVPLLQDQADLILPDLRGFGESESTADGYSLLDMAADMAGLLDNLKIKQAVIAGHSMGGYIALAFAHAFPKRVLGLALAASQALPDTPDSRQGRYDTVEKVKSQGVKVVADAMPPRMTPSPELQPVLREITLRQRPEGIIGALRALAERPDATPYLAGFDFPVSIVHGLEDALIPIERAREVQSGVAHGYLVELNGVGHMPMMEAPKLTAEALKTLI